MNNFFFFKLTEKFVEKVTKDFLVRKDNISLSKNILQIFTLQEGRVHALDIVVCAA